jgi:hypothetical protein
MSTHAVTSYVRTQLHEALRKNPYQVNLLVGGFDGVPKFNKLNLVRIPLRLCFDVFETGEISKEKKGMLFQSMKV